ncbi:MAG: hypothetical protein AAF901_08605, partial [Bacteroidota bacterium]
MLKSYLTVFLLLFTVAIASQDVIRTEISGKIVVETDDKEGITVFNSSSNRGTITDEEGKFKIKVAFNDVVVFGALQFQDFMVVIDQRVLDSKQLTVFLVEEVNKLDEVLVLPYDLSGNLAVDVESSRTYNVSLDAVYFGLEHPEDFEFSADYKTAINNPSVDDQLPYMDNGLNVINFVGLLASPFIKSKKREEVAPEVSVPSGKLSERYDANYLKVHFGIPLAKTNAFIAYVEDKGIDSKLLAKDKEVQLLEFISQQSK